MLVDRLWPRGLSKEKAHIDIWLKDIAPSTELRKWFGHDIAKWIEFKKCYHEELKNNHEVVSQLMEMMKKHSITIVYGAKDEEHNNAVALQDYLEKK